LWSLEEIYFDRISSVLDGHAKCLMLDAPRFLVKEMSGAGETDKIAGKTTGDSK